MTLTASLPVETSREVRDTCLCLHAQRAARVLARRFDAALKPFGLTNGQFSLLMAVNGPQPAALTRVAALLGADRTTLTAALKPLRRDGLVEIAPDPSDSRVRRIALTPAGQDRLAAALPAWRRAHADLEEDLGAVDAEGLRRDLRRVAGATAGDRAGS